MRGAPWIGRTRRTSIIGLKKRERLKKRGAKSVISTAWPFVSNSCVRSTAVFGS